MKHIVMIICLGFLASCAQMNKSCCKKKKECIKCEQGHRYMKKKKKFNKMDKNGDGMVTEQEFLEGKSNYFKKKDSNGDGKISLEEWSEGHDKKKGHCGKKKS